MNKPKTLILALVITVLALGQGGLSGWAQTPPPGQEPWGDIAALRESRHAVRVDERSGKVRFIGLEDTVVMQRAQQAGMRGEGSERPEDAAARHLERYGRLFGLREPAQEMRLLRIASNERGSYARYQQYAGALPVLNGELIVQVAQDGTLLSLNGKVSDYDPAGQPVRLTREQAEERATAEAAAQYGQVQAELRVSDSLLVVYDPHLLDSRDGSPARVVWQMEVFAPGDPTWNEWMAVDAKTGRILLHFNQVPSGLSREVYDWNNGTTKPALPTLVEGGAASSVTDVNLAYAYAGDTYNFYFTQHGRDSIDNQGMAIVSNVRFCSSSYPCPYTNAYWDDRYKKMFYGEGMVSDDVVAHELTHGVTTYSSNLLYYLQSGALNEAFSDAWGEFVDLTNGKGNDDPSVRWLMGEDLPASIGIIRDMADPLAFGDPDRMTSPAFKCSENYDNGGVHSNSGVLNKAVTLLADGGTFNGQTVGNLGIEKTAAILYEVQVNLLPSGGEYSDLYNLLPQACLSLVGKKGITTQDCGEVRKAVTATEMNLEPTFCPSPVIPVSCANGTQPKTLYSTGFETVPPPAWAVTPALTQFATQRWALTRDYVAEGKWGLVGLDGMENPTSDNVLDSAYQMTVPVSLASGFAKQQTFFQFSHSFWFDFAPAAANTDGGVVEYSLDGITWNPTSTLPVVNGPRETMPAGSTNPLAGRPVFTQNSKGWLDTRYDLTALNASQIALRFRLGLDASSPYAYPVWVWAVDNVRLYACEQTAPPPPPPPAARIFLPSVRR